MIVLNELLGDAQVSEMANAECLAEESALVREDTGLEQQGALEACGERLHDRENTAKQARNDVRELGAVGRGQLAADKIHDSARCHSF